MPIPGHGWFVSEEDAMAMVETLRDLTAALDEEGRAVDHELGASKP